MKNWKKAIAPATIALALLIPAAAYAAEQTNVIDKPVIKKIFHHGKGPNMRGHHMALAGTHQDMYMQLLAEKYAPDTVAEWTAAQAEREQLLEQLKAKHPQEKGVREHHIKKEFTAEHKQLMEKFKNGEITEEELKAQLPKDMKMKFERADKPEGMKHRIAIDPQKMEEHRALQQQFTEAIEAKDADQIKAVLPKLLEQLKQENTLLKEKIAELPAESTPTE